MSTVTITDLARENVRNLTPYQSAFVRYASWNC